MDYIPLTPQLIHDIPALQKHLDTILSHGIQLKKIAHPWNPPTARRKKRK